RLDSAVKVDDPKVSPNQLQPSVGGDGLGCKFDLQKTLAWKKKIGSTQSHLECHPCRVVWSVWQLLYLLQRAGHFKFCSPSFFFCLGLTSEELTSDGSLDPVTSSDFLPARTESPSHTIYHTNSTGQHIGSFNVTQRSPEPTRPILGHWRELP